MAGEKHYCWSIDFCRLLFTMGVCLMHFESAYFDSEHRIFEGCYLAVEFFFILSGYLLQRSIESGKYNQAWDYVKARVMEFFPYSCFMLLCYWIWYVRQDVLSGLTYIETAWNGIGMFFHAVYEILFFQMFLPSGMWNGPIWYISVLIVIGGIYFWALGKYGKAEQKEILLLLIIGIYMFLNQAYAGLDIHTGATPVLKIAPGVVRGIADMGVGILSYQLSKNWSNKKNLVTVISIFCIMAIMFQFPHTRLDFVIILFMVWFIINEFSGDHETGNVTKLIFSHIRKLSLSMYFCHSFLIKIFGGGIKDFSLC